VLLRP